MEMQLRCSWQLLSWCSAEPVHGSQVPVWGVPVQRHAVGVGGVHAEVYAHQGQFVLHAGCAGMFECVWVCGIWSCSSKHLLPLSLAVSSSCQNIEVTLPCPMEVFEMLVVPEHTYPLICVAVSKGTELNQVVRFGALNPNSTSSWFTEAGRWCCLPPQAPPSHPSNTAAVWCFV